MKKEKINSEAYIRNILTIIIKILIVILIMGLYILIWHFVLKAKNDNVIFWTFTICYMLGWQVLDTSTNFRTLGKVILSIIGVPLYLSHIILKAYSKGERKRNINSDVEENRTSYKQIINNAITQEKEKIGDFLTEPDYYCQRCFKQISKEEYELNDWMCEECYAELEMMELEEKNKEAEDEHR